MAFWAPPFTKEGQQSIQACHAALNSVQTLTQLNNELDVNKKNIIYLPYLNVE